MDNLLRDLKFTFRTLLKRPVFAAIAVLTLALGIGANTAIFSLVNSVLLAPLPFKDSQQLVVVWDSNPELAQKLGLQDKLPVSPGVFYDWKQAGAFSHLAMMRGNRLTLTGSGNPELLGAVLVSGEFFEMLGTPPLLGRTLQPVDDQPGKPAAVVLSQAFWQRRFGSSREMVGKAIVLDGEPLTIVGIMPASFNFPRSAQMPSGFGFATTPDVWLPMALSGKQRESRGSHNAIAVGRLKPGVGLEAAQAELDAISARLATLYPQTDKGWKARTKPLADELVGEVRPTLLILMGAVGVVVLIACVNVANLLLAQGAARQKEISVRLALGAGRRQLVNQLLTESLVLAVLGGTFGLLVAFWGLRVFNTWIPANISQSMAIEIDSRVLAFTLAITLATGTLSGLAPALQTTRSDLAGTLRDGTRAGVDTRRSRRTRNALVIAEIALAALLVVCSGLLARSFAHLTSIDPGFRPEGVLSLEVVLPEEHYDEPRRAAFFEAVLERLRNLSGVITAGAVSNLPMTGSENIEAITIEGQPPPEPGQLPLVDLRIATPGYFETLGIPLQRGRVFSENDSGQASAVAVVDDTMARTYWPDADPLGKRFHLGSIDNRAPWFTVVGVVGNVRNSGLHVEPRPQAYLPMIQKPSPMMTLVVRSNENPERLVPEARASVFAVDPNQPVSEIRTLETIVESSLADRRFNMVLLGLFAGLALTLAMVGIYGITSYSVSQRTREMGLRMALGAAPARVLGLVLREAGTLALAGLAAGLVLAFVSTRVLASLLFGVDPTDPATFLGVSLGLALTSLVAAFFPGRRATLIDPMVSLRAE